MARFDLSDAEWTIVAPLCQTSRVAFLVSTIDV